MKKARFNYTTAATATSTAVRKLAITRTPEKLSRENALPTPPSEETVARLNAIAREYPFCAYIRQTNLFLL